IGSELFLMDVHFGVGLLMRRDLDAFSASQIFFQYIRIVPFPNPAVFNGHERIAAGNNSVQRESSIGIGLVAAKKRRIAAQIERRENDHYAGDRLVFLERCAGDVAGAFRSVDGNAHVLRASDLKGTAGGLDAGGGEAANKEGLWLDDDKLIASHFRGIVLE